MLTCIASALVWRSALITELALCWALATNFLPWTKLCPPQISYVEALIPNGTVFGDGAFEK